MITINTAQNNFNNQHSIKFESRIIPTQSLKNTISHNQKCNNIRRRSRLL